MSEERIVGDFPSNSHKKKPTESKPDEKRVEKMVSGRVIKKKRGLGKRFSEAFMGDDSKNVGEYIIYDVLIPAARDTIVDMVRGAIEMLMWGEKRSGNTRRSGGNSYTSYGAYYKSSSDGNRGNSRREMSRSGRSQHNFDEVILESRGAAEDVLSALVELIIVYGQATVADFYDAVGITTTYADNNWGWTDLRSASVSRVREGYLINLPRTRPLND